MATKKISSTEMLSKVTTMMKTNDINGQPIDNGPAETKKEESAKEDKVVLVNFEIKKSTRTKWKKFAVINGLSLKECIKKAMAYYMQAVEDGRITTD